MFLEERFSISRIKFRFLNNYVIYFKKSIIMVNKKCIFKDKYVFYPPLDFSRFVNL